MIEIIPAIDMVGGRCVRLTQGDYDRQTTYYEDPLDAAKAFEQIGIRRLHMVDLDGAKASAPVNLHVLERVANATGLEVQYGGGIKGREALHDVFSAGAARAICGSIAAKQPEDFAAWLDEFGGARLILGADARNGRIATHGWLEESSITVPQLIERFLPHGLTQTICTDISRDGMLCGPSDEFYESLQQAFPAVEVTVSGGISCLEDIVRLNARGLRSVIVGKAIYEGRISLNELEQCLQNASSPAWTSATVTR